MMRRPPSSPLFPPTPLSQSELIAPSPPLQLGGDLVDPFGDDQDGAVGGLCEEIPQRPFEAPRQHDARSEEHTSELQSPCNLVCRLLLAQKRGITPLALIAPA